MAAQYDLNLRDYTRIIKKRKIIIIFSAIVLGIFSLIFSLVKQPTPLYKATASVRIERQTTVTGLYVETISWSEADTLETQAAIAISLPVIELVAKKLGIIDAGLTSTEIRDTPTLLKTVLDLKAKLNTLVEGETNLVNISATTEDPRFSMKMANTVAEAFQELNTNERNRRTIDARKFIEARLAVIVKTLKASQSELKALREEKNFVSMDSHTLDVSRRLEAAEARYETSTSKQEEIQKLIEHLELQQSLPKEEKVGFYSKEISPVFTSLNANIDRLTLERDVMLIDFTHTHPEVERLDLEIESTIQSMMDHLQNEKRKNLEVAQTSREDIQKYTATYYTLPEISFDLDRIKGDIESYRELLQQLQSKYQEVLIKEAEKIQEISLVKPAILPPYPVNPPTTVLSTLIGLLIGGILGLVLAFIRETMDTSIGTIEDVEEFLGVPVVGIIPHMSTEEIKDTLLREENSGLSEEVLDLNARLVSHFATKSTIAESYRALRTGIDFVAKERGMKTVVVSSSSMREGKTTVTSNLAMVAAQIGKKVLLIDADLRKPKISTMFGIEKEPGLSDVILGNYNWNEVIKTDTDIMMGKLGMGNIMTTAPGIHNLHIITSGLVPPNSAELLNSSRMSEILNQAKDSYDLILVDSSPVLQTTDAVIISAKVDGVVLVYQVGEIARGALKRAKAQLENAKATVLGVVLNGLKPDTGKDYKDYGYYGQYTYGVGDENIEPWYRRRFKMPEIISTVIGMIKGAGKADEPPELKPVQESSPERKKKSTVGRKLGWLKTTIIVIVLTLIFYGILWQFGILTF